MKQSNRAWITECPRDAMQGIPQIIPTSAKINYLNKLLKVGFDRLDFGSFVSPKAIPQMGDTARVLEGLETNERTELIAIIANVKGASNAAPFSQIRYVGYPFSISETFQQKNTNSSITESFDSVKKIMEISSNAGQELLIYISMAFGNPYGDTWNNDIAIGWIDELTSLGIRKIALADTVGVATEEEVYTLTKAVIDRFPDIETGVHLHCHPGNWKAKTDAAFIAGCRHFDSAMMGFGGCPMAGNALVGNLSTENLIQYLQEKNVETRIRGDQFKEALLSASTLFYS